MYYIKIQNNLGLCKYIYFHREHGQSIRAVILLEMQR